MALLYQLFFNLKLFLLLFLSDLLLFNLALIRFNLTLHSLNFLLILFSVFIYLILSFWNLLYSHWLARVVYLFAEVINQWPTQISLITLTLYFLCCKFIRSTLLTTIILTIGNLQLWISTHHVNNILILKMSLILFQTIKSIPCNFHFILRSLLLNCLLLPFSAQFFF